MSVQITVRGEAENSYPPERAVVDLAVALDGPDREAVMREVNGVHEPVTERLRELAESGVVSTWSSDQVQVASHRPWNEGSEAALVHTARVNLAAEFADLAQVSEVVGEWALRPGLEVVGLRWDLTPENRTTYETDLRVAAVEDAVAKAQAYADAVLRGRVAPIELADPGMLDGKQGSETVIPLAKMAMADSTGGPSLEPQKIVIRIEVDARFRTE
jgi:uncharacterized protein YggE